MTSYAAELFIVGSTWERSARRFSTRQEAANYACMQFSRTLAATDYRVMSSTDPVNSKWVDNGRDAMAVDLPVDKHCATPAAAVTADQLAEHLAALLGAEVALEDALLHSPAANIQLF